MTQQNSYSIFQSDPIKQIIKKDFSDQLNIQLLALHYHTSLIAFTATTQDEQSSQIFNKNTVIIFDDAKDILVGKIKFRSPVINIKFRKDAIIIQLHCQIYIYNLINLELIDIINCSDNLIQFDVSQDDNDFVIAYSTPGLPDKLGLNFYLRSSEETKIVKKYIDKLDSTLQQITLDSSGQICIICTDKYVKFIRTVDQQIFGQLKVNGNKISASVDQTADYFGFIVGGKNNLCYIVEVPQIKQMQLNQVEDIELQPIQVQKLKESIKFNIDCNKYAIISMQKTLNTVVIITDKNHYEKVRIIFKKQTILHYNDHFTLFFQMDPQQEFQLYQQVEAYVKQFVSQYYQILRVKENRPNVASLYTEQCISNIGGKRSVTNTDIFNSIGRKLSFGNMILSDEQYDTNFDQQRGIISVLFTAKLYTDDGFAGNICHSMQLVSQQDGSSRIANDIFRTLNIHQITPQEQMELQQILQMQQQRQ